jgi:cytosine/adenosine deaminase-related metal-dependent hydrolase
MPSPGRPTLERLDAAGLLRRPASLVHANFPGEGDARLLRDRGVVIVHCPGAHAWFDRGDFDIESWWAEGVDVALGTDSLAGNAALDMGREVSLFREAHPGASPGQVFDMATKAGARALGLEGRVGALSEGSRADLVLHLGEGEALEMLTSGVSQVQRVWVSGRDVHLGEGRAL